MAERAARASAASTPTTTPALAHALTRLVVLPFRVLRPDPETDFLAFSLPDAISTSLSGIGSLIVRSSAVAARFAGETPDLKALAAEADVDRVVMGTLLRSGDQLRAAAQLVEAPGRHAAHVAHGAVVARRSLPAAGRHRPPRRRRRWRCRLAGRYALARSGQRRTTRAPTSSICAPTSWRAPTTACVGARDLYRACLELDSRFAPAWAHLGRCHRVIGKYIDASPDSEAHAEDAFRRALALSPRLTIAHKFYANLEADTGHAQRRAGAAARRGPASRQRSGAVCRAGSRLPLLRAVRAIDRRARRSAPARSRTCRPASSRRC